MSLPTKWPFPARLRLGGVSSQNGQRNFIVPLNWSSTPHSWTRSTLPNNAWNWDLSSSETDWGSLQRSNHFSDCLLINWNLLSHLKNGDPGIADVVKVDGSFERIDQTSRTVTVVLVPVDTGGVVCAVVSVDIQNALCPALIIQLWDWAAVPHPVVSRHGADEGVLVIVFSVVVPSKFCGQRAWRGRRIEIFLIVKGYWCLGN